MNDVSKALNEAGFVRKRVHKRATEADPLCQAAYEHHIRAMGSRLPILSFLTKFHLTAALRIGHMPGFDPVSSPSVSRFNNGFFNSLENCAHFTE